MGAGEINVAYDGTFGDLGAAAAGTDFFNMDDAFDFVGAADSFMAVTGTNPATISPKELLNDSVPPSSSFTNLTTPASTFLDTPDDEYQTSPLFSDNLGLDAQSGADSWFSLFPESDAAAAFAALDTSTSSFMTRTTSASSIGQIVVHPGGESTRKRSSVGSPSALGSTVKHSSVAGVGARKRDKPLPPIMVNESDPVALKRARNTAAARKSRAKKVLERDELEAEIADLKAQVEHWKSLALAREANQE